MKITAFITLQTDIQLRYHVNYTTTPHASDHPKKYLIQIIQTRRIIITLIIYL